MLLKIQLRWAGHVSRMEDHRLPKLTFFGELASGFRDVGGQYKRYKDTLKRGLIASGIDHENWETTSKDRDSWRLQIKEATDTFEKKPHRKVGREKTSPEKPRCDTRSDKIVPLQPLWQSLPITYRTDQSSASLLQIKGVYLSNLRIEVQAIIIIISNLQPPCI